MASLEELAHDRPFAADLGVPAWTLGCFHRRSITYATGAFDDMTEVIWVQSHGMTGDIRIPPNRPRIAPGDRLNDMDRATLIGLAGVEGAAGDTFWSNELMSWDWWCSYQPYEKWSEAAILHRIGDCMIEFAPSRFYVEDWRYQAATPGAVAGLRLIAESDGDGDMRPRDGGLILAGGHAIRCLARRDELPNGTRCRDFVRDAADPLAAYARIADCVADYAIGGTIFASTDPWREEHELDLDGFEPDGAGELIQRDGAVTRRWRIASLGAWPDFSVPTESTPEQRDWLRREADTLLVVQGVAE